MIGLTSGRCENSSTSTCNPPQFLYRKKYFWVVHPNGSTEKSDITFFGYLTENVAVNFSGFMPVKFSFAETPRRIQRPKFTPFQKQCLFGSICGFSSTKLRSPEQKNSSAVFFGQVSNKFYFEIFDRAILGLRHPNVLFQGWKSWKKLHDKFGIFQQPKVTSYVTVHTPLVTTQWERFTPHRCTPSPSHYVHNPFRILM